jgi:hypothetical protein
MFDVSLDPGHDRRVALQQAQCGFDDYVEDGLDIGGRAADDVEDFGRRRLALERFLRLVEQTDVLDRDHRLVGEGLQQVFVPAQDRPGPGPGDGNRANGLLSECRPHGPRAVSG